MVDPCSAERDLAHTRPTDICMIVFGIAIYCMIGEAIFTVFY
jgi:hypothetical protein